MAVGQLWALHHASAEGARHAQNEVCTSITRPSHTLSRRLLTHTHTQTDVMCHTHTHIRTHSHTHTLTHPHSHTYKPTPTRMHTHVRIHPADSTRRTPLSLAISCLRLPHAGRAAAVPAVTRVSPRRPCRPGRRPRRATRPNPGHPTGAGHRDRSGNRGSQCGRGHRCSAGKSACTHARMHRRLMLHRHTCSDGASTHHPTACASPHARTPNARSCWTHYPLMHSCPVWLVWARTCIRTLSCSYTSPDDFKLCIPPTHPHTSGPCGVPAPQRRPQWQEGPRPVLLQLRQRRARHPHPSP